jgi:hypothetical protein
MQKWFLDSLSLMVPSFHFIYLLFQLGCFLCGQCSCHWALLASETSLTLLSAKVQKTWDRTYTYLWHCLQGFHAMLQCISWVAMMHTSSSWGGKTLICPFFFHIKNYVHFSKQCTSHLNDFTCFWLCWDVTNHLGRCLKMYKPFRGPLKAPSDVCSVPKSQCADKGHFECGLFQQALEIH